MNRADSLSLPASIQPLTDNPMGVVWRYLLAFLGGFLAMGGHFYLTSRSEALFSPGRLSTSLAAGLFFGILTGVMVILASEYPQRLKNVWSFQARAALAITGGIVFGTLAWFANQYLLL